jgi:hypothetical protein
MPLSDDAHEWIVLLIPFRPIVLTGRFTLPGIISAIRFFGFLLLSGALLADTIFRFVPLKSVLYDHAIIRLLKSSSSKRIANVSRSRGTY